MSFGAETESAACCLPLASLLLVKAAHLRGQTNNQDDWKSVHATGGWLPNGGAAGTATKSNFIGTISRTEVEPRLQQKLRDSHGRVHPLTQGLKLEEQED